MGCSDNETEVERALKVLADHGIPIRKLFNVGLYLIKFKNSSGHVNFSLRRTRFTPFDARGPRWPADTQIAKIDIGALSWEPIFPHDKGSPAPTPCNSESAPLTIDDMPKLVECAGDMRPIRGL